jgi:iron(III) transport system ATP-binding protein
MPNAVELFNVTKIFSDADSPAVCDFSLSIAPGEQVALVGPSGSGKTTILRLVAGFLAPDTGTIALDGQTVAARSRLVPPEQRDVGMVFQDYALFPHLTARQNIAFGLNRKSKAERERRVSETLELVGLADLADRYPHELSGGQQQRVALARAIAPRPIVILLDEPFSSLDAGRREQVREDVSRILRDSGISAIFVTHDQDEALFIGDRLAVLNAGRLEQVGAPEDVFGAPRTRFVAEFMGKTDFLPGEVTADGIRTEIGVLDQPADWPIGARVEIAFRPDDVRLIPDPAGPACITERHFKGAMNMYCVRLASGRMVHSYQAHTLTLAPGTPVRAVAEPGHALACFAANGVKPA